MNTRRISQLILIPSLLLALAGCSASGVFQPKADNSVFYILSSKYTDEQVAALKPDGLTILIGPSTAAKFLDQPQIVTYEGTNILDYSDLHRWAEPLNEGVDRILLDEIAVGLETSRVGFQRVMGNMDWDYQVGYHVYELGGELDGQVELQVAWWVTTKDGEERTYDASRYIGKVQLGSDDPYAAYVEAIKGVLVSWGKDVVKAIDAIRKG